MPYDSDLDKTLWESKLIKTRRGNGLKAEINCYDDGKLKLCLIEWSRDPKTRRVFTTQLAKCWDAQVLDAVYRLVTEGRDALEKRKRSERGPTNDFTEVAR